MLELKPIFAPYRVILSIVLLVLLGTSIYILAYKPHPPISNFDTSYYQHVGLTMVNGTIPYVNAWIAKPPLVPELQWLLASISRGNKTVHHWLNVIITTFATIGAVFLSAELINDLTGDSTAALAGGLGLLSLPAMFLKPAMGFRPKLFTVFFGMMSLWLQGRNRPLLSGSTSCLAMGFWQIGIVFPVMSTLMALKTEDNARWRRTVIGVLITGLLVLLPIVAWDAFSAMVVETIAAPILLREPFDPLIRMKKLGLWTNFTLPVLITGMVGLFIALEYEECRQWWLGVGLTIILFQVLFIDLDGPADAVLLFCFLAIGLGLMVTKMSPFWSNAFVTFIVALVLLNGASELALIPVKGLKGVYKNTFAFDVRMELVKRKNYRFPGDRLDGTIVDSWQPQFYWADVERAGCYYLKSAPVNRWMRRTGGSKYDRTCGDLRSIIRYLQSDPIRQRQKRRKDRGMDVKELWGSAPPSIHRNPRSDKNQQMG